MNSKEVLKGHGIYAVNIDALSKKREKLVSSYTLPFFPPTQIHQRKLIYLN